MNTAGISLHQQSFNDFDAFLESVVNADVRFTLPRLDKPHWSMSQLQFDDSLSVQFANEGSGNIAEGTVDRSGHLLYIQTHQSKSSFNGIDMLPGSVFWAKPGSEICISVMSPNDWISIFIPNELASTICNQLSCEPNGPEVEILDQTSPISRDMWGLIHRYISIASQHPQLLQEQLSVASFHNSILFHISALFESKAKTAFESRGRKTVIDRNTVLAVVEKINTQLDTTISISELAAEMGLSEKTLRNGFTKYYGMPPTKYIQLQRLHRAKKLLQFYGREGTSVSSTAAQLGMWDFGRFAARYKALFGESPSETLVRSGNRVMT